jgi:hypothetical protein
MSSIKGFDFYDINMIFFMQAEAPPQREITYLKLIVKKVVLTTKYVLNIVKNGQNDTDNSTNIDVLFFGESSNNNLVFNPIIESLHKIDYKLVKDNSDYPLIKSVFLSIQFLPQLFFEYVEANSVNRKIIRSNAVSMLSSWGKFILARQLLRKYNPEVLFMANDHSPFNRCLLHHAKNIGIKTCYMQHASVSDKFPSLEFDYSLLDGQESFEKYRKTSKRNSKVILCGSARYDKFYRTKRIKNCSKIGISINQLDNIDVVKNLCLDLRKCLKNCELVVRPHPNMIDWNRGWFESENIEYSEASTVSSDDYLKSLKLQISNVSGIHLDAAMMNVPTVLYQLSKQRVIDHYGYLVSGLIKEAISFADLLNHIKYPNGLVSNDETIQYYVASVGTSIEGKVGEFTANYIRSILNIHGEFECDTDLSIFEF